METSILVTEIANALFNNTYVLHEYLELLNCDKEKTKLP